MIEEGRKASSAPLRSLSFRLSSYLVPSTTVQNQLHRHEVDNCTSQPYRGHGSLAGPTNYRESTAGEAAGGPCFAGIYLNQRRVEL